MKSFLSVLILIFAMVSCSSPRPLAPDSTNTIAPSQSKSETPKPLPALDKKGDIQFSELSKIFCDYYGKGHFGKKEYKDTLSCTKSLNKLIFLLRQDHSEKSYRTLKKKSKSENKADRQKSFFYDYCSAPEWISASEGYINVPSDEKVHECIKKEAKTVIKKLRKLSLEFCKENDQEEKCAIYHADQIMGIVMERIPELYITPVKGR